MFTNLKDKIIEDCREFNTYLQNKLQEETTFKWKLMDCISDKDIRINELEEIVESKNQYISQLQDTMEKLKEQAAGIKADEDVEQFRKRVLEASSLLDKPMNDGIAYKG